MKRFNITLTVFVILFFSLIFIIVLANNNNFNDTNNITTNELQTLKIDTSEKIAKLYNRLDKTYIESIFVKDMSQKEVNDIKEIINRNEKIIAIIEYINPPNYILEFNDTTQNSIQFRINSPNSILLIVGTIETYTIYIKDDVKRLEEILDIENTKNITYTEIDIQKTSSPPTLYIDSQKLYQSTNTWSIYNNNGNELNNMLSASYPSPQDMLKNVEPISSIQGLVVSTNQNLNSTNLTTLPNTTKLSYTIYKDNDIFLQKEATRMIDGSYHLEIPYLLGSYIYVLDLTFDGLTAYSSIYCFKYSR